MRQRYHDLGGILVRSADINDIIVSTAGLDILSSGLDDDDILASGALDLVSGNDQLLFGNDQLLFGNDQLLFGNDQLLFGADADLLFGADPDLAALSSVISGSDLLDPVEIAGLDIIGSGASRAQARRQAMAKAALAKKRKAALVNRAIQNQKKQNAQRRLSGLANMGIQPTLAVDTGYTKARTFPFGLQADADTPAGAPGSVTRRPQTPIKVRRLVVPSVIAAAFLITDIKVGKDSQLVGSDPIPAEVFAPNAVAVELGGDTANVGHDVTIAFTNISGAAQRFRCALIGPAVE